MSRLLKEVMVHAHGEGLTDALLQEDTQAICDLLYMGGRPGVVTRAANPPRIIVGMIVAGTPHVSVIAVGHLSEDEIASKYDDLATNLQAQFSGVRS